MLKLQNVAGRDVERVGQEYSTQRERQSWASEYREESEEKKEKKERWPRSGDKEKDTVGSRCRNLKDPRTKHFGGL